jgi:hypothetical protein
VKYPASVPMVTVTFTDLSTPTEIITGRFWFYAFPGLEETKVVRRCAYCGNEFSVKTPLHKCPNCGGDLELVRD